MRIRKGPGAQYGWCFGLVLVSLLLVGSGMVWAQSELMIYPKKGQSQKKMEQDKSECYTWAKQQTGFDPMAPPTASTPPPQAEAYGSNRSQPA